MDKVYKFSILSIFSLLAPLQSTLAIECFSEHLSKAIHQNRERRSVYSSLSEGKSKSISNKLIFAEKFAYLYSLKMNFQLKKYRKAGIPILCLDFIEMSKSPSVPTSKSIPRLKYQEVEKVNLKKIKTDLYELIKMEQYQDITDYIEEELANTSRYGNYNCLVKHVLESLGRTAYLTPFYLKHAYTVNLKSPKRILNSYLRHNISSLDFSHRLDKDAAKIQEEGIPILCRDVPHIPLRLEYEMELF